MADIVVDTYKLDIYAQRLRAVNSRIQSLDRRMNSLYLQVGLLDLFRLIQADTLTVYSYRLRRCAEYLEQTAKDFQRTEKDLDYDRFVASQAASSHTISLYSGVTPAELLASLRIQEYIDLIHGEGDLRAKAQGAIAWLASVRGDLSKSKEYIEWIHGAEIDFPSPIKDGLDFIKALDISNKLAFGAIDYGHGLANGDVDTMKEGFDNLLSALKGSISLAMKTENLKTNVGTGLLLDYGKNMITNWLDAIKTETKVYEVYWSTFVTSGIQVYNDTVCNATTLAIAYKPARVLSAAVGYDLQGAYENVSDKTGFAAVTDSVSQLGDLIVENSSWETWSSGMKVIGDSIAGWFK